MLLFTEIRRNAHPASSPFGVLLVVFAVYLWRPLPLPINFLGISLSVLEVFHPHVHL
jgi:hypothetical protein